MYGLDKVKTHESGSSRTSPAHRRRNIMPFETLKKSFQRLDNAAGIVLIPASKRVGLNSPACKLFKDAKVEAVLVMWDRATHTLALKAAKRTDQDAYTIQFHKNGHSATFSAAALLRWIGWTGDERITVPAKWMVSEKRLEAVLPKKELNSGGDRSLAAAKKGKSVATS
jgi:hypothetical protein